VPFSNAYGRAMLALRQSTPPEPPRARRPEVDVPDEAEEIVMRALAFDPAARFARMAELRDALKAAPAAGPKKRASGRRSSSGEIRIVEPARTPTPPSGAPVAASGPSIEILTGGLSGAPATTMQGLQPLRIDPQIVGLPPAVEPDAPADKSPPPLSVRSFVAELRRAREADDTPVLVVPAAASRAENVSKPTQLEFGPHPLPARRPTPGDGAALQPPESAAPLSPGGEDARGAPPDGPPAPVGRTLVGLGPLIDMIARRVRGQQAPAANDAVPQRPRFQLDDSDVYVRRHRSDRRRRAARRVFLTLALLGALAGAAWFAWARSRGIV
jgi:hypothetical protein